MPPRAFAPLLLLLASLACAAAYTDPQEGARSAQQRAASHTRPRHESHANAPLLVLKLLNLRDELTAHGLGYLLGTWTCPSANPTECDPCGRNSGADDSWGYLNGSGGWEHIACRTYDMTAEEFPPGTLTVGTNMSRAGVVTNIHLARDGMGGNEGLW